jgi:hypothetical protein
VNVCVIEQLSDEMEGRLLVLALKDEICRSSGLGPGGGGGGGGCRCD